MKKKNMQEIIMVMFFIKTLLVVSMIASIQAFKLRADKRDGRNLYDRTHHMQTLERICMGTKKWPDETTKKSRRKKPQQDELYKICR